MTLSIKDKFKAGEVYIIFGSNSEFPSPFDLNTLNGKNGFRIPGLYNESYLGGRVSIKGDVNGDNKEDIILSSDDNLNLNQSSKNYIIFGAESFHAIFDLTTLDGTNGFIAQVAPGCNGGLYPNNNHGDLNGDGITDFAFYSADHVYVVFGNKTFPKVFYLSTLNGINGFKIPVNPGYFPGPSISLGKDINGDNIADLMVGNTDDAGGPAYVIFGASRFPAIFDLTTLEGQNGFKIIGALAYRYLSYSVYIGEDFNGDGYADFVLGDNSAIKQDTGIEGAAYVIYGFGEEMGQNYGMLSQIQHFAPMNSTDSTGKMNIGLTGDWCTYKSLFIGDFNGDERSDLLCSLEDGATYVMLSQLNAGKVTFAPMGTDPDGRIKVGANDKWCVKSIQQMLIGDFNGDGKADLLCHNNQQIDQGYTYVMLSTGDGFKPMSDSPDGYVKVGRPVNFCPISGPLGGRLLIGNFDGWGGDDLLCNSPVIGNMIMVANITSFVSVNGDPLGIINLGLGRSCIPIWCTEPGSVLMAGHFNNDNRADLICNVEGENQIMISTFSNVSCVFQPIYPASGAPKQNGSISMGQGSLPVWCNASKSKLVVADINGDKLSDLVCSTAGVNQIQLCNAVGGGKYEFKSMNASDPSGDGRTKIADYDKWCNSQNLFSGDFSGNTLDDLWCNQNYSPVGGAGEIYEEDIET